MPLPPLVAPGSALDDAEARRTVRQRALPALGDTGQRRLAAAHVAVVGAGGLGAPVVLALAAAGIGQLTVIDDDVVELGNLQRQIIHRIADVGRPKAHSAVRVAAELSPGTQVNAVRSRLDDGNATGMLAGADVVIDGTDLSSSRTAIAAACEALAVPLVWGAVQGTDAQVTVFWSTPPRGVSPVRLSDVYPDGPDAPGCAETGVLGAVCLQAGAIMATQAIALIAGVGEPLLGRMLVIDALRSRQREVALRPAAADAPRPTGMVPLVSPADFVRRVAAGARVLDVREADEAAASPAPSASVIPLSRVLADPDGAACALSDGGEVIVVCRSGARARRAATVLEPHIAVSVLDGGLLALGRDAARG